MDILGLKEACLDLGIVLSEKQLADFVIYKDLLKAANETMNLTAITADEEIIEKHFYDSLLSAKYFEYEGRLCDVGSGAGFPGLVLKIAFPQLDVVLAEPIAKRCRFLESVIEKLELKKIAVINKRAEDLAKAERESFDIVTARAVKSLDILSELCVPLIKVGGSFVILKGSSGKEEITKAQNALKTLGTKEKAVYECELISGDRRVIAIYEKARKTDKKYPRNYGTINKRPL